MHLVYLHIKLNGGLTTLMLTVWLCMTHKYVYTHIYAVYIVKVLVRHYINIKPSHPLYSATLPVPLTMDSEQLPGVPADSWLPPKHASTTEMWMEYYCSTWILFEAGFQKHWHWLTWFHYCGIRDGWLCKIVWFPEQSHLAVREPWTSLLASIHQCYSTGQWIPSLL